MLQPYQAAVVGAGPGGLAATVSLLDKGITKIAWIDPKFTGGRLNELYREISSNTKVGIYLDAVESSATCRGIIERCSKPNAVTKLEEIDRDKTTLLAYAGDVIMLLIRGVLESGKVEEVVDEVEGLEQGDDHSWTINLAKGSPIQAERIVLCTGSHPIVASFHEEYNSTLEVLELDEVLRKSHLPKLLHLDEHDPSERITVGVIGNSHSGVLAIRNFYEISTDHKIPMTILSFERRPILYAEYREDGIVHDNTGLKGDTADWSKEIMESDHSGNDRCTIRRINLGKSKEEEKKVYQEWLPQCSHLVYAIGYARNTTPHITYRGKRVDGDMKFDMRSSGFHWESEGERNGSKRNGGKKGDLIPGLFGCGIAFPEEVEDPEGNVEAAVGVAKFFKFAERVNDQWVK